MAMVEVTNKMPDEIFKWLEGQPVEKRGPEVDEILENFRDRVQRDEFIPVSDIEKLSAETIEKEFRRGGHRKIYSKKLLAKLDGKTILHQSALKKTTLFITINAANRKRIGFSYSVANYFETPKGYVYIVRQAVPRPVIFIFTAHFFDRFLQRGLKNNDHAARMVGVFRLLRFLDRRFDQPGSCLYAFNKTNQAYLAAMGGLCLGSFYAYKMLPPELDFNGGNFHIEGQGPLREIKEPEARATFLFMTYVSEEMLCKEQKFIYNALQPKLES